MTHSPTAFMKGTEIWLRYNENPEPVRQMRTHETKHGWLHEAIQEFRNRYKLWQSSFVEVKFQDQEAIQNWVDGLDSIGYIKLDAISDRIEIHSVNISTIDNPFYQPVAVLLPAEETKEESQDELLKALLLALADKQDALSKFIITRRK